MLNTLRNQSGSLWAKLLLILLVLSFGVWGIEDMLRASGRNSPVAVVGDTDISRMELAQAIEQESEAVRQMLGKSYSPEVLKKLGIANQALEKLINLRLLDLEAQRIGLRPSTEDIADYIRQMQPFLDAEGNFSKDRLQAILANKGISERQLVADVRQQLGTNVLTGIFTLIPPAPDIAVKHLYKVLQENRTADLLVMSASNVQGMGEPDEAALKAYHEAHGNLFTAPERRSFSYIILKPAEIANIKVPTEEEIKQAYEDHRAEFAVPEQRDVSQLIFGTKEQAEQAVALIKSGTKFADIANTRELGATFQQLGFIEKSSLPAEAGDKVFTLTEGQNSAPVETPFGWHIFRVEKIKSSSVRTLNDVRETLVKDLKQRQSESQVSELTAELEDALAGGSTLEEAAAPYKIPVNKITSVTKDGKQENGSVPDAFSEFPGLLENAFRLEEKTESSLISAKPGVYFIVRVENVQPEHIRTLDEVRPAIIEGWKNEQRMKKLQTLAQDAAKKLAESKDAPSLAPSFGRVTSTGKITRVSAQSQDGQFLPPDMIDELFRIKPGQSTRPYQFNGDNYAIGILRSVSTPAAAEGKEAEARLAEIRKSLAETMQNELLQQYIMSLRNRFDVQVNDAVLQEMMQQ